MEQLPSRWSARAIFPLKIERVNRPTRHVLLHTSVHCYNDDWITKCDISNSHNNSTECLLLLILMLWQRQAIFELKGAKLSSSDEWIRSWKVRPETTICIVVSGLIHQVTCRLNAHSQTDWAIEDQAKNLNSIAFRYDEWAFSPLAFTADWLSHLALAIYMFCS